MDVWPIFDEITNHLLDRCLSLIGIENRSLLIDHLIERSITVLSKVQAAVRVVQNTEDLIRVKVRCPGCRSRDIELAPRLQWNKGRIIEELEFGLDDAL